MNMTKNLDKSSMEVTIDTICEYEGLGEDHCPNSYTAECYTCENNQISKFKDVPIEILLCLTIGKGKIPKEALKLNREI